MSNTTDKLAEQHCEICSRDCTFMRTMDYLCVPCGDKLSSCSKEQLIESIIQTGRKARAELAVMTNAIDLMRPLIAAGSTHPVWAALAKLDAIGEDE